MMASEAFQVNPFGVDFDPEDMWQRLQAEGEETLAKEVQIRGNAGPRGFESIPAAYMA